MNLHQIKIGARWAKPHILRHPTRCSECPDLRIRYATDHLRTHNLHGPTWICECSDRAIHDGQCANMMCSEDANVDDTNHDPYRAFLLDPSFPYIYVCPDCRTHDHGRTESTR